MTDDNDLLANYLDWTSKALKELDELLANLGSENAGPDLNDQIFTIAHNIKGMGTSFGFDLMTDSGTSLCTYMRTLKTRSAAPSVVGAHLQAMKVILDKRITGPGGDDGKALITRLTQLAEADISQNS